ncbi:MAG TPA: TRAP transporter large permease subunit [Halanaerobiales bacterium]|nr:TRAP transporter large permease subunit [Halanaerobiales bacterium]
MAILLLSLLFGFLIMGLPIFLNLMATGLITLVSFFPMDPLILIQRGIGGVNKFSLLAIPFFLLAAQIVSEGEIGERLIKLAKTLVGHLPGGLALTTVVTCMIFGAISGAGAAAVVAIGSIVYPALTKSDYGEKFSMGLILSSSSIAMLVPPGIAMVLYAILTGNSIANLFIAGLGVGILLGLGFMIYSYIYAKKHDIVLEERATLKEVWDALKEGVWALGLPVIIIGGIYSGVFTPTEAAGVSVAYAAFVEMVIYKDISVKELFEISCKAGNTIAMIMILIAAGSIISWVMTIGQLPQMVVSLLSGANNIVILLLLNVVFLIAGMFIDPNSAIIVLTPLVYPLTRVLGIDPIHFGMIIVLNLSIGMITPPFGLNIFVATGAFDIGYERIVSGILPFIIINLIILMLITFVPQISLFLPRLLLGG